MPDLEGMFQLTNVALIFFSLNVVLTPHGQLLGCTTIAIGVRCVNMTFRCTL